MTIEQSRHPNPSGVADSSVCCSATPGMGGVWPDRGTARPPGPLWGREGGS